VNQMRDSGGQVDAWSRHALQTFAREFMCRIRLSADVTDDAIAAPAALANLMHGVTKCLA
jgi:hypothetical protein